MYWMAEKLFLYSLRSSENKRMICEISEKLMREDLTKHYSFHGPDPKNVMSHFINFRFYDGRDMIYEEVIRHLKSRRNHERNRI